MKTLVSKELKSRLVNAAANGSVIASDILSELKKGLDHSETIRGMANYFSTKRKRSNFDEYFTIKIVFTVCTKDLANEHFPDRNNPQAPWFAENRMDVEASTFIGYFKNLPPYENRDLDFFISAIALDSRVDVRLYSKMSDFMDAYNGDNYSPIAQSGETSLHSSCMRHGDTVRNTADFYHNFAGAKLIVAKDSASNILGRAIVWENVTHTKDGQEVTLSVLDRIYFSHQFIVAKILEYAQGIGIQLRKRVNDYKHPCSFVCLNAIAPLDIEQGAELEGLSLRVKAPSSKWYKKGAPYLDTFSEITVTKDGAVELRNVATVGCIASARSSDGVACKTGYLCPKCGKVHTGGHGDLCEKCRKELYVETIFGSAIAGKTVKYKESLYPSVLFSKGRPTSFLSLYLQIQKLY